ncbi:MAG TPA: glutamate synthase large subunit [Fibrobacteria bacterium]|nr:glutamate synthase large subunit [Fibrobacteria bacterium]
MNSGFPRTEGFTLGAAEGLYDPRNEHDACGVGFVVHIKGKKSHSIVAQGIQLLVNLEHRGAAGAEANSGDGAGILTQIPHKFFAKKAGEIGIKLPAAGDYGVAQLFLPHDKTQRESVRKLFEKCAAECGQRILGWRVMPTNNGEVGESVKSVEPSHEQAFFVRGADAPDTAAFERKLYVVRKHAERTIRESGLAGANSFYCGSLSCRTIVYKGLFTSTQVLGYFPDLTDADFESALALVHSRFSTNTFPTWPLAHPFRYLAHNGEINTLRGNENWMRARESLLESKLFTADEIKKLLPIIDPNGSDSAKLDNVVELLLMGGRKLPHVMAMMIPEAWEKDPEMSPAKRDFYEYHGTIMEPWDGPASVAFTDGEIIGATLDRNGLRPSRYQLTSDDILVMASEAGVLPFPAESIVLKGRLQPGKMFVVSLAEGRIIPDEEIKLQMASQSPYGKWLRKGKIDLASLPMTREPRQPDPETVLKRQKFFGYTLEDLKVLMSPMVNAGEEALGSMGNDAALAVLSDKSRNLFDYFHQLFAQVTNPPIDKDREEMVMSLTTFVGKEDNLLEETPDHCRTIELPHPVLTNEELERLRWVDKNHFQAKTIPLVFKAEGGEGRLGKALARIRQQASEAVQEGYNVLVLSDRPVDSGHAAVPSLLAVSAVHHHLIREGLRARCGIVIETGEAREVHHFALLLGYGASAINPYLAFETIEDMRRRKLFKDGLTLEKAEQNFVKAVNKGLLKVISKMGISTIQSYIGAQIFEAVGLGDALVNEYFTGTASRLGGIDLATLEEETLLRHRFAWPATAESGDDIPTDIEVGGQYQWRQRGERHMLTPDVVHKLQHAVRTNDYKVYEEYARLIDVQGDAPLTLRGLLDFAASTPIPLEEVEPASAIVKRFASGAMSFGSISWEAHTTLALAMNRIGGRSNTGEGGEDASRFKPLANGDSMRSSIKQVASGRFGVTSEYLVNSDEIQIKMAQGAKPGEGGQLPGWKVDKFIAKTRHSTPGVGLISPPPHHDIYSIEDLAQLIFDLKNSNDKARISVKLVAEVGVGTVAAGVAKAHSDVILISGYDGGTGASPQTSIKHAGLPWELGLAEAHQVLIKNGLRSRVVLQTDGMLRTGRDIAIATLLGAEEWGVATGGLIAMGCIMMRKCHLNTCPVGIATQDEDLRKLFPGEVQHVVNFYLFLAEDFRRQMAALGFRTVEEMVGRVDMLKAREGVKHWKAKHLDLGRLLYAFGDRQVGNMHCCDVQDHGLDKALDWKLMEAAKPALESGKPVKANFEIRNVHRTVGTILSSNVTRKYGAPGLPEDTIHLKFTGSAGQSFGAFAAPGVTLEIEGEANDYVGKGLSGGKIIVYPPKVSTFDPAENVLVGNVCFYGATGGQAYIRGKAGERFCVRNSGAEVVAESCGDHGCEYMTGGRLVLLGSIGRNFGAGMSGGVAYLFDPEGKAPASVNREMVDLEEVTEAEEAIELKGRIERHLEYTGSAAAKSVLADWKNSLTKFVKVMPRDYKRAMAEMRAEAQVKG